MVRPGQFTLAGLFIATAFVAAAAALVRFAAATDNLWAAWLLPILIGGAVGAFRGRISQWLGYGMAVTTLAVAALWLGNGVVVVLLVGVVFVLFGWQR